MLNDAATSCWLTAVVARPTRSFTATCNEKGKKARVKSWALIRESIALSYSSDKKAGHAEDPYVRFIASSSLSGGNPHDVITFPLVFRCAVNGNPLESGSYSFVCKPLNN
ncbi:hypothetical protein PoB_000106400 [Plakobranchus ocellatus]|uniref:Uncharacterized protein n=1 Tax=Plakobranchus ocellatus TaxID=259542 RepID=A0AAV3XXS6_9GAST|nr:hypothetical protein PoB_000106400 [Plakobranchus ocellatus]